MARTYPRFISMKHALEYCYSPWTGCKSIEGLHPNSMSPIPIYTPGWRETKWSKVSCLRKQHNWQGLNPRPPDPEFKVLTTQTHTPPMCKVQVSNITNAVLLTHCSHSSTVGWPCNFLASVLRYHWLLFETFLKAPFAWLPLLGFVIGSLPVKGTTNKKKHYSDVLCKKIYMKYLNYSAHVEGTILNACNECEVENSKP